METPALLLPSTSSASTGDASSGEQRTMGNALLKVLFIFQKASSFFSVHAGLSGFPT